MSIFTKRISQLLYFRPQILLRTDFGSSCKNFFEYAGIRVRGYTRIWLNLYVRWRWFAIKLKFMSPNVIFFFYVKKVERFFFLFIFCCKLNVFVLYTFFFLNWLYVGDTHARFKSKEQPRDFQKILNT